MGCPVARSVTLPSSTDAVGGREPVGRQPLVDDLDPRRDGHVGPVDAGGVDVDLRGRGGVAGLGRVEVGRQLAEAFPAGRLPDRERPSRSSPPRASPARRFGASQKLWPAPSWTTIRLVFTSSLAKSARTAFRALASPRHSACHWPPPNGGPSHQAMRPGWLKIAAAPAGQPGSGIGLLPVAARDQRGRLPRGGDRQDGEQQTRRDSGHGIPREHAESHTRIYGRERVFLAEIS